MSSSKETKPFEYFDSPDGHDVLQKFGVIFKPVALTAFAVSTTDVMLYSHPKGYLQTLGRYVHFGWPIFGAAAAFVLGHNLAGSIRNKDDKLNWFIGGASAGGVLGLWRKTIPGGVLMAGALGVLALSKKHCVENGYDFIIPKERNVQVGSCRGVRRDWTLMAERPKNWTTGEEKQ
ncbi:unnamed protein product [Tenebrio molitor]|jgi:NADH dehydrogenase (ubiquinone) 1 alpha subcomplex subunit 11|nr:unnamed protein product [Tenebrio molitor]